MNARTSGARRRTYLILAMLLATIVVGVRPQVVSAQRAAGSIGVALTVLRPVALQPVIVTGFRIDPDGMATLRAMVPTTSGTSQLVMTRVAGSVDGFVSVRLLPVLDRRPSETDGAANEVAYRIDVGRSADGEVPRNVRLRLEYLVVAGT